MIILVVKRVQNNIKFTRSTTMSFYKIVASVDLNVYLDHYGDFLDL